MAETFKGYYLPPSLADVEQKLEMEERSMGDARVLVPRLKPEDAYAIANTLRENRSKIATMPPATVADVYDRAISLWKNDTRPEKQAAMKYLPALTDMSPEMIERFLFGTLFKIDRRAIEAYLTLRLDEAAFKRFIPLEGTGTYMRGYMGLLGRVRFKYHATTPKSVNLVMFLAPSGTPGYYECLGILLGSMVPTSTVVKTDPGQPLFAPMFARSVAAVSPDIGETFAVLPWKGGDAPVEDAFIRQSSAVNVVGNTETTKAVESKINDMNQRQGLEIKGCYHGSKLGFELIAKEHATRDVARLAAIDGIGNEGHTSASPAFGYFVERGGPLSPEQFAEALAGEAGRLSQAIPQTPAHREAREKKMAEMLAAPDSGRRAITAPGQDFAIIYEPKPSMKPDGQDRLLRVMPIERIEDVIPLLKPWTASLQTAGIAVPDSRLMELADRLGKAGITSLRVTGTMTQPKLGEAWDGNLPVMEYYLPDAARWVSINAISVDREIGQLTRAK
ncbi:MAG TPA: acyl-CoA reductase [Methanocella sp.]|jgi:hypothetical protein